MNKLALLFQFFIISIIVIACSRPDNINSDYLNQKKCIYQLSLNDQKDTLLLKYHLVFDTSTFVLAQIDTSRKSLYQSSYFAWHASFISYCILKEISNLNYIKVCFYSDSLKDKIAFKKQYGREGLEETYSNQFQYNFISYMIDSINVEDYFIYNKLLSELYEAYNDPRLTWNYSYLVNQLKECQCGNDQEDVSFEIFLLLNAGIELSTLEEGLKQKLIKHNRYFMQNCLPLLENINHQFDKLNISFANN